MRDFVKVSENVYRSVDYGYYVGQRIRYCTPRKPSGDLLIVTRIERHVSPINLVTITVTPESCATGRLFNAEAH